MGLVVSMTGYGRGEARGARTALIAEARSLNHRFLETSVKLPRGLTSHEPDVRRLVQGRIARGRVDVTVTLRRTAGGRPERADRRRARPRVRAGRARAGRGGRGRVPSCRSPTCSACPAS